MGASPWNPGKWCHLTQRRGSTDYADFSDLEKSGGQRLGVVTSAMKPPFAGYSSPSGHLLHPNLRNLRNLWIPFFPKMTPPPMVGMASHVAAGTLGTPSCANMLRDA